MLDKPKIVISEDDCDRIDNLLHCSPKNKDLTRLAEEIDRAEIVGNESIPENVVKMHSNVTFTVLPTQKTFTYTLVYPHEATTSDKLSILTPAGSALLGLSIGAEIEWPLEGDKTMRVRIDQL